MLDSEKKVWSVDHYRGDEYNVNPMSIAAAGFKTVYSPQYYIEKFIYEFEKKAQEIPEEEMDELNKLTTPSTVNSLLGKFILTKSKFDKTVSSYALYTGFDYNAYFMDDIKSTYADLGKKSLNLLEKMVSEIICANNGGFSEKMINFLITSNTKFAEGFITSKTLPEDACMYLTLTKPWYSIPLLDKNGLLTAKMIDTLCVLNPYAIIHIPDTIKAWSYTVTKFDSHGEPFVSQNKTNNTREEYITIAIKQLLELYKKEKEFEKENDDMWSILSRLSHDGFGRRLDTYSGFSYELNLDENSVISALVNESDKIPYVKKLRSMKLNMLKVKDPSLSDMSKFVNKIIKLFTNEFLNKHGDNAKKIMEYITQHKDRIDNSLYQELEGKYYGKALIDELHDFIDSENKKKK